MGKLAGAAGTKPAKQLSSGQETGQAVLYFRLLSQGSGRNHSEQ